MSENHHSDAAKASAARVAALQSAGSFNNAVLGLTEADLQRKGWQRGSVRQRNGNWYIRYSKFVRTTEGRIEYRGTENKVGPVAKIGKREAERIGYERFVSEANGLAHCPQGIATLEQFWEVRFKPDHVDRLKKSGRIHYDSMWKHIEPALGAMPMHQIAPVFVQAFISAKIDAGLSPQTVTHLRNAISAMFRHARSLRFFRGDLPTEGVKLPEMRRKDRQALTPLQVTLLLTFIPEKHRPLIILLVETGLRIGEACGLRWAHVNLDPKEWKIAEGVAIPPLTLLVAENFVKGERGTLKSSASRRMVPLTSRTMAALASLPKGDDTAPVFAGKNGQPLDSHNLANRVMRPAAKAAGMEWASFHCLRHTAATMADRAGLSVSEKQRLMGHAHATMASHYTHPEVNRMRELMEKTTGTVQ